MNLTRLSFLAAVSPLAILLPACASESDPAKPVVPAAVEPTPQATPVVPRRTVEVRNPFGNTQVARNLMADGDFELTGRRDQQPWLAFGDDGQSTLNFETGGRCRSGVRCLTMAPGEVVVGWMATPQEGKVTLSLWARPEGGTCKDLRVQVIDIDEMAIGNGAAVLAPEQDEQGNCFFEGLVPSLPGGAPAVWLEVTAASKAKRVLVDDVVALPATGASTRSFRATRPTSAPARFQFVSNWIRTHRRFGLPSVNAAGPDTPLPRARDLARTR